MQNAMSPAIAEIDDKTNRKPDKEPEPVLRREREHQEQTKERTENRHKGKKGRLKGSVRLWMTDSHHKHRQTHYHKREQSANIHKLRQNPKRDECGH